MLWVPTRRKQLVNEDGKALTKGQYKVYSYLLLCGRQASGRDTFTVTDEVGRTSVDSIARACNLNRATVGTTLGELYKRGLVIKKNREDHVGFAMFMPAQDCEYARVDEKKALMCFAYGAPDEAWEIYAMSHWGGKAQFDMKKAYREIAAELGGARDDKVEWALEWLKAKGMVGVRMVWDGGSAQMVLQAN